MNPSFFNRILVSLLIFSALVGVFLFLNQSPLNNSPNQCVVDENSYCSITLGQELVYVRFLQEIELEEELQVQISLPKSHFLRSAWVQGVNMYMGKTPVIINQKLTIEGGEGENSYQGVLFLGACSEPNMRWQLIVQTKDLNQTTQVFLVNFKTYY
ncbi:hypothetical protein L0668_03050 [Paraglaciecola aquimarina]|uniref:Uncharacterized protein n=1 Tax=Paraglaciecola algarum TaxID=3050085 RepID=A0ABS9D2C5_9ALTE|nr:hypothetical protein [Paraglaciecola sp. G1-23]MCF2947068.1 hypothetical protein [Paraglaciecola sp. G1-23]